MDTVIFDSPAFYKNKYDFYFEGSSPIILEKLIEFITTNKGKIKTITISLYLFNNPKLHLFFKQLISETVIHINIISIPLEGYDSSSPQKLKYINGKVPETKAFTKYEIAKRIYDDVLNLNTPQYKLYIFPHMYIRSKFVKPFSRGQMPYSLHSKLFFIEYLNGERGTIGITSSNMAARDLVKYENLLILENTEEFAEPTKIFFNDLMSKSILLTQFDNSRDYLKYEVGLLRNNEGLKYSFSAPFYHNSPKYSENLIIDIIKSAQKWIYIVAQHISAYKYSYYCKGRKLSQKGILWHVLEKSKDGINVKCLSQTFIDGKGESKDCRQPKNINAFKEFMEAIKLSSNCAYAVNPYIHSKYIIIDDKLIITTCNFTPTQFIYIKDVEMNEFKNMPNVKYKGVHSEVGAYFVIEDPVIVEKYVQNMENIWNDKNTIQTL